MIKLLEAIVPPPTGRGPNLHETLRELRIKTLPVTYNRDIDRNADGTIDERDRRLFRNWIRANISRLYSHPACLDYENPFWRELADLGTSPERFREILTIHRSILAYAKRRRPLAKWGFFGLPRKLNFTNQTEEWRHRVLAFSNLLRAGSAAFPSIYDAHVGDAAGRHPEAVHNYIALCLEAADRTPVYVVVSGRYHRSSGLSGEARWIPDDEFTAHVSAGLDARWTSPRGVARRIAGIVLWDGYGPEEMEMWPRLDELHAHQLRLLHRLLGRR